MFCEAMAQAGLSIDALAAAINTTPKTIKSWRRGTVPRRPAFRAAVVDLLRVDAADLWPANENVDEPLLVTDATDEIVTAWAHRADAPKDVWRLLLDRATERIDLMAYAMQFLPEENPRLDRAERWGRQGDEDDPGGRRPVSGMPLPPTSPARIRARASAR